MFSQLPIEISKVDPAIVQSDFCPMFKTLSKIGFFRSVTDPAGFLQILCTSVSHMNTLRSLPASESSEAIVLSTQAIQSVNHRLADPALNTSDGVVAAVLAFSCHTVSGSTGSVANPKQKMFLTIPKIMFNDVPGSKTHLQGLEEILRRRGGLGTLDPYPAMRMVLFW